jgi:subtilisin family serine protease
MPFSGQRLSVLFSAVLVLCLAAPAVAASLDRDAFRWADEYGASEFRDGQVLPGRLIVRFAPGSQPQESAARDDGSVATGEYALDRVSQEIGVTAIDRMFPALSGALRANEMPGRDEFYIFQFDPQQSSVLEAAQKLATLEGIVSVEPDEVYRSTVELPNDPGLSNQWWLRNTLLGGADIRAVAAWNYSTGSENVVVCVADSGVDWQHPDLGGTGPDYTDGVILINDVEFNGTPGQDDDGNGFVDDIYGWDFVNFGGTGGTLQTPPQDVRFADPDPMDYGGHGTAVTGCISAIANNGIGIASTNWTTKILACKIGWTDPNGDGFIGMSWAAQSMDYARNRGADVFNASWGSGSSLTTAANFLQIAGVILCESAGNGNSESSSYLGSRSDVVSVAATNENDFKAGFSTYGTWVEISAPGTGIWTTSMMPQEDGSVRHNYTSIQGTSFSSPIVAGAMAMAKAAFPGETRQQTIDRVLAAVDDIDSKNPNYIGKLGTGRLNLFKLFEQGNPTRWPVPGLLPTLFDAQQFSDAGDTIAVEGGHVIRGPYLFSAGSEATIMGGYDPTYTSRDPLGNPSVFELPVGAATVLTIGNGVGPDLILDGFQVTGGFNTSPSLAPDEGIFGAGLVTFNASPTLRNFLVNGNRAGNTGEFGYGAGVTIIGGSPTLENFEITGNSAMSGAGLYVYDADPTLTNINIHDNTTWTPNLGNTPYGGGACFRASPPAGARRVGGINIDGANFSGNVASGPGGGLYAIDSELTITNATFANNTSVGAGAGIAMTNGMLDVSSSSFIGNSTNSGGNLVQGGGLFATGAAVTLDDLDVRNNSCNFGGGGVAVENPTTFSMSNSTVVDNVAGIFGGGVYVGGGTNGMSLTGSTIAGNSGGSVGANGVYVSGGDIDLQQNVIAFNVDGSSSPNGVNLVSATATFTCNLLHGNTNGNVGGADDPIGTNGNIDADPMFCDAGLGEYTLDVASPAAKAACGFMGSEATDCSIGTGTGDDTPSAVARRFALEQNRPNPFNPSTQIQFSIPAGARVQLRIYDLRGRLVRALVDQDYEAGTWQITWNGRDDGGRSVASGTYLYELRADDQRKVRKMGLLK